MKKSEVTLVLGYPASGKTTVAMQYVVDRGEKLVRLNRDTLGGSISGLLPKLDVCLAKGEDVLLDNLFPTKASRADFVSMSKKAGATIKCIWLDASLEDAQFNACLRMIERYGKVLHPDDHKKAPYNTDSNMFPVAVLYKYKKEFEPPTKDEGFDEVTKVKFQRIYPKEWVNKAVILDYDGTLREHATGGKYPTDPKHVSVPEGKRAKLDEWKAKGYMLLGASNQSGIAKGDLTEAAAVACFEETNRQVGHKIDYRFCPHKVPPITCYCRKPGPGMGVELIVKYKLDPRQCIYVGDMTTDKSFAGRCHFKFMDQKDFFK